jgi:hypothetical protein
MAWGLETHNSLDKIHITSQTMEDPIYIVCSCMCVSAGVYMFICMYMYSVVYECGMYLYAQIYILYISRDCHFRYEVEH